MKGLGIVPNWQKKEEVKKMVERIVAFCRQNDVDVHLAASEEAVPLGGMKPYRRKLSPALLTLSLSWW